VPIGADEAPPPEIFFERVRGAEAPVSLVAAADACARPRTREAFEHAGATLFTFEEILRGARLARATEALPSKGPCILLFLHSDTLLPPGWEKAVRSAISAGAVGGAFRLAFDGGGARMAWVAFWANRRTAFTGVPYGDQAPFVRRDVYLELGGHRPWPLMEDVDFARRLRARGRLVILPARVKTSPRRYLTRGVAQTVLTNWKLLLRFRRGESPEVLAEEYRK
jgi:hypothetical protein